MVSLLCGIQKKKKTKHTNQKTRITDAAQTGGCWGKGGGREVQWVKRIKRH